MAEASPKRVILAFGLFTMVVFSLVWFISSASLENPGVLDSNTLGNFNNTLNKFQVYQSSVGNLESTIEDTQGEEGIFGFLNSLINPAWNILKSLFTTFSFVNDVILGFSYIFGIPPFIPYLAISLIGIIIVFGVLSVIFNRDI